MMSKPEAFVPGSLSIPKIPKDGTSGPKAKADVSQAAQEINNPGRLKHRWGISVTKAAERL